MTDLSCGYSGDRDEALIAFLYDAADARDAAFEGHCAACARCRDEIATLRGVRAQLARWSPPEPSFAVISRQSSVAGQQSAVGSRQSWWREIPAWAQVAAALLFLGVSAGIANLDVRYDRSGLSLRTGWSKPAPQPPTAQGATAPWRTDLSALERQLKTEFRASQVAAVAAAPSAIGARTASAPDLDTLRRLRALVDESEKRQQRELALRVAEVMRDVNDARQADLRKIDRSLGLVQNNLGVEVMKQRESLNLLYRASQRQ
jgi:hypothetical protein